MVMTMDIHTHTHSFALLFCLVLALSLYIYSIYNFLYLSPYISIKISAVYASDFLVFFPQPNNTDFKFVPTIFSMKLSGVVCFHAIFSQLSIYSIIKLPSQIHPLCIYIYQYEVVSLALNWQYISLLRVAIKESRNVIRNCFITLYTDLAVINTGDGCGECSYLYIKPRENEVFCTESMIFGPD